MMVLLSIQNVINIIEVNFQIHARHLSVTCIKPLIRLISNMAFVLLMNRRCAFGAVLKCSICNINTNLANLK